MGIYIERSTRRSKASVIYSRIPEFDQMLPKNVLEVNEGTLKTGSIENSFCSFRFHSCSGLAIKDQFDQTFGLFHVFPGLELTEEVVNKLKPLSNGEACLIQGSDSTEKSRIIRELSELLGIQVTNTISVDTHTIRGIYPNFHVAYRPKENQVLVASISLKNVLTFPAFTSSLDNSPINS